MISNYDTQERSISADYLLLFFLHNYPVFSGKTRNVFIVNIDYLIILKGFSVHFLN